MYQRLYFVLMFLASFPVYAQERPKVLSDEYALELVVQQPEIVTPVGLTIDSKGRLLVIENHTHQRAPEYQGPTSDRIRMIRFNEQGRTLPLTNFFEGTRDTMCIESNADGSTFVSTRREIFRLRDQDEDGTAESRETLIQLETAGDYPHNGLSGIAFDDKGGFYFGLGENLGERYRLIGADGKSLSGGGEGGSVYHCRLDGGGLERIATGFWNPFGLTVDPHGRVFCTDNDPDASPPCRLIHVVHTGDYGYEFRFGRSGRHPLQAWDGELPGTLGMLAGTGEAPCEIIAHRGRLWITSWGDHRIETYQLKPRGATFDATRSIVVQGDQNFRPVGLAIAADGSIYFTDWVDRSYPVHAKGAIWRLRPVGNFDASEMVLDLTEAEHRAEKLRHELDLSAFDDPDPFVRQAAVSGLASSDSLASIDWKTQSNGKKLGILQALRWRQADRLKELLAEVLQEPDEGLRLFALRAIADERVTDLRRDVAALLDSTIQHPKMLSAVLAVLAWLDQGSEAKDSTAVEQLAADIAVDAGRPIGLRTAALGFLPYDHSALDEHLHELIESNDYELASEAVRIVALRGKREDDQLLSEIANDVAKPDQLRADAIAGLANSETNAQLLRRFSNDSSPVVKIEAVRTSRHLGLLPRDTAEYLPRDSHIDQWMKITTEPGDRPAGRRVFFRAAGSHCFRCHQFNGRGNSIGPELTQIHRRADRKWLLESILNPSQEVSPRYAAVNIVTADGRVISGLSLTGPGETGSESFAREDGSVVQLTPAQIESRTSLSTSIMPSGFDQHLSVGELRDLTAFLMP